MARLWLFALILLARPREECQEAPLPFAVSPNSQHAGSLPEAAQHAGVLFGAAVRPQRLGEEAYATTLAREFNLLEPEGALKWEFVHPSTKAFDYSLADRVAGFALEDPTKVRGHTLVWQRQNPDWPGSERPGRGALAQILKERIEAVMRHTAGRRSPGMS